MFDIDIDGVGVVGSDEVSPSALAEELAEFRLDVATTPGKFAMSPEGMERVKSVKDRLFSPAIMNDPTLVFGAMFEESDSYTTILALHDEVHIVQKFLDKKKAQGAYIIVNISHLDLDPKAFEWALEYLRRMRMYQCGLVGLPPAFCIPEKNHPLTSADAVECVRKALHMNLFNYSDPFPLPDDDDDDPADGDHGKGDQSDDE